MASLSEERYQQLLEYLRGSRIGSPVYPLGFSANDKRSQGACLYNIIPLALAIRRAACVASHLFLTRLTKDLSNVIPLQLVQGIQLLETQLGMKGLVDRATTESCSAVELKKAILKKDRGKLMANCLEHRSTKNAAKIATNTSWLKCGTGLWIQGQWDQRPCRICIGK